MDCQDTDSASVMQHSVSKCDPEPCQWELCPVSVARFQDEHNSLPKSDPLLLSDNVKRCLLQCRFHDTSRLCPTPVALSKISIGGTPPMNSKISTSPWQTHSAVSPPNT